MLCALDLETTGLCPWKDEILGIGVYCKQFQEYFHNVNELARWVGDNPGYTFVMHNGSFDVNFLRRAGLDVRDRWQYDTRTIASILYPWPEIKPGQERAFSLENLCINLFPNQKKWKLDRSDMSSYTPKEVEDYCLEDCKNTYNLFYKLFTEIDKQSSWAFVENWIMPATKEAANLEYNGLTIDLPELLRLKGDSEKLMKETHANLMEETVIQRDEYQKILTNDVKRKYDKLRSNYIQKHPKADRFKIATRYGKLSRNARSQIKDFNFNSTNQLIWLLNGEGLDTIDPMTRKESTGKAVLKNLETTTGNPVVKALLDHRRVGKLLSSNIPNILDNIKPDGRVHGRINVGGTRTGRLSSSGPNLQQVTKGRLRTCMVSNSPETVLYASDYSQLEVRIIAELSREPKLVEAFKADIDPYGVFAKDMFSLDEPASLIKELQPLYREAGKVGVLSILYRTGPKKLKYSIMKILGTDVSTQQCKGFIESLKAGMPVLGNYDLDLYDRLCNRKIVYNLLGRPFRIESNNDIYMKGLNTMVQGSASDLLVYTQNELVLPALNKAGVWYENKLWVHDEAILELRADEAEQVHREIIEPAMCVEVIDRLNLEVPLKISASISRSWEKAA